MFTRSLFPLFSSSGVLLRRAGELLSPKWAAYLSSCIFGLIRKCVHIWIIIRIIGLSLSLTPSTLWAAQGVYGEWSKNLGNDQKKGKCLVLWELWPLLGCTSGWGAQSRGWWIVLDQVTEAFTEQEDFIQAEPWNVRSFPGGEWGWRLLSVAWRQDMWVQRWMVAEVHRGGYVCRMVGDEAEIVIYLC